MYNIHLFFYILFFTLNIITLAQEKFFINFRTDIGFLNYEFEDFKKNEFYIIPIQNIYFALNIKVNNDFTFQLRPGLMLNKHNFEGFEMGSFVVYDFCDPKIFINAGCNFHFNIDKEGNSGGTGETASFLALGIGYRLSKILSLEFSDHLSLKGKYGFFFINEKHRNHSILNILKIGLIIKIGGNE